MFEQFREMLKGGARAPAGEDHYRVAIAALLVQAALMDDSFDRAERQVIEQILLERFDLSSDAARQLLEEGVDAAERSNQLFAFTRLAAQKADPDERVRLIEMLWEVAYADGVLDPHEDALVRRIAGLIYVSDRDRGAARARVLARLGLDKTT